MNDDERVGDEQEAMGRVRRASARVRRSAMPGGRKLSHQVKVTEQERSLLTAKAQRAGVSVSRLLVESALADPGRAPVRGELFVALNEVRRKVAGVSVNVNQMARHTNATGEFQETAEEIRGDVVDVCRDIARVLDQVMAELP